MLTGGWPPCASNAHHQEILFPFRHLVAGGIGVCRGSWLIQIRHQEDAGWSTEFYAHLIRSVTLDKTDVAQVLA
jgi:hypothetical protein